MLPPSPPARDEHGRIAQVSRLSVFARDRMFGMSASHTPAIPPMKCCRFNALGPPHGRLGAVSGLGVGFGAVSGLGAGFGGVGAFLAREGLDTRCRQGILGPVGWVNVVMALSGRRAWSG